MNIVAPAVVVGRTRRAALLALGDATDVEFLKSKRWDLGKLPLWRCASNNSVVCNDISQLPDEFWETYRGKGEAMGLVNINLFQQCGRVGENQYPDPEVCGVSACAEQGLASGEVSCLGELMLPHFRTPPRTNCGRPLDWSTRFANIRSRWGRQITLAPHKKPQITICAWALALRVICKPRKKKNRGCPISTNVFDPTMLPTPSNEASRYLSNLRRSNHQALSVS